MAEFSSSLEKDEIHVHNSPFNEDFKNIFFSKEAGKFRENRQ